MCERPDYSTPPCNETTHIIPCFCSGIGGAGDTERINACKLLGVSGEWRYRPGDNLSCFHYPGSIVEGGSILGYRAVCERATYQGDIAECCQNPGICYSSNGGTCAPEARSYTGNSCQNYYLQYCGTSNMNELQQRWEDGGVCRRALTENSLAGNKSYVSELGSQLLGSYFRGGISEFPNELQNLIYDICRDNPLACDRYLSDVLCKDYNREDLVNLTEARKFCGCHLPDEAYETFESEIGGTPKECDSICVSASNIRPVDSFGNPLYCQRNICIIDSVTIDLVNSNVGDITFGQLCGDCGEGSCVCIVKDIDIDAENSNIGGIDLSQECKGNQKCYQTASNGNVVEVDCDNSLPARQDEADDKEGIKWWWVVLAIAGGVIILALIFIVIFIFTKK